MIYYLLLGLIWTAFIEFVINAKIEGEPFNNRIRFMVILIWPFSFLVYVLGFIRGFRKGNDDE
jgi:hypothetical protein